MSRPNAVTAALISRQGILPTVAPVKPYTELAEILRASWRPSSTALTKGSVAAFRSALARLRAPSSSSKISGSTPLHRPGLTKTSPVGDRVTESGSRPATRPGGTSVQ